MNIFHDGRAIGLAGACLAGVRLAAARLAKAGDSTEVPTRRSHLLRFLLRSIAFLALLSTAGLTWAQSGGEPLLLEVYINGQSTGKIGEFVMQYPILMVRRSELADLGFRQPNAPKLRNPGAVSFNELVALSDVPGLHYRIDTATQSLYITVLNDRLEPTSIEIEREVLANRRIQVESGTGATLNYDVSSTFTGKQKSISGLLDSRGFTPRGVFSSGLLGYAGTSVGGGAPVTSLVRLDSTYTFGDVGTLRRYSIGDFISTGLSWTRPVRLEGLQVRSDFGLRPDLVTFPLPTVTGSVAVPSAVSVLADGNLVVSRQIDAGPFEIPQLPVASGAGTISLTVTNALGQQVRIVQPFYTSASLLRPGLQNFSVQGGLVRLNWGILSNDYGKLATNMTYRRGLNSKFTVEGSAEGTQGVAMAGGGGLLQVKRLGVLNFAAAASAGSSGRGAQLIFGAQRLGRAFSAGASLTEATSGFHDVAARNGDPVPRRQSSANVSFSTKTLGSLGAFYAGVDRPAGVSAVTHLVTPAQNTSVVSVSYTRSFRHVSLFLNGYESLGSGMDPGVQVGVSVPLGPRQSLEAIAGSDGSLQLQAQRSPTAIGEWGYQAYIAQGGVGSHEFAQAQYKSKFSLLTAGVDSQVGTNSVRVQSQGAVSFVDGGVFPSNTIYDSFAIVDTGPTARVHVLQENREVGDTGRSGRLLVPDLRSYDLNRLAIIPSDVGLDTTIQQERREIRPRDRSGVVVRFEMKISHAALLQLTNAAGEPIPVGSTARLRGSRDAVPVGYDGDAYVEDLKPHNEVEVLLPDGTACVAAFNYKPLPGEIPKIGPLRCLAPEPESGPHPTQGPAPSDKDGRAKVAP